MTITDQSWKKLFWFCLGVALAAGFCMKWMENDFWAGNERFTILGLELFYSREKMTEVFSGMSDPVRNILRYHLSFDFAFMAGVYPGIASLCMLARQKTASVVLKRILLLLAMFQLPALAADIAENNYLFSWINNPVIGDELGWYHFIVLFKWIFALGGALLSIPVLISKGYKRRSSHLPLV